MIAGGVLGINMNSSAVEVKLVAKVTSSHAMTWSDEAGIA